MAATIVGPNYGAAPPGPAGGVSSAYNVTTAQQIKGSAGILASIAVIAPGSAGGLTLVDNAAPAYSATVSYVIGNAVTYSGTLYWCILASLNNLPTNGTYWATTAPASQIITTLPYNAANVYAGALIAINWPLASGLIVAAVPSAGSPIFSISFT